MEVGSGLRVNVDPGHGPGLKRGLKVELELKLRPSLDRSRDLDCSLEVGGNLAWD